MRLAGKFSGTSERSPDPEEVAPPPTFQVHENISMFGDDRFLRKLPNRIQLIEGSPPLVWLSRVIAHPSYTALYNEDGFIIPESSMYAMPPNAPWYVKEKFLKAHQRFEPQTIDPSDAALTDDVVVFGGAAHAHYGHHLLDGMSRFWFHSDRPTLYLEGHLKVLGYRPFVPELLSLGRRRTFYNLHRPTQFRQLLLPHASVQSGFLIYGNADLEHRAIARTALRRARLPVAAKVYLSRGGIANRKCDGEEQLEEALAQQGFDIISPEQLPLVEQIAVFNRSDWIVGAAGSAFHNLLFSRRPMLNTVQLTWAPPNLRFPLIDRLKGQPSWYARTMAAEAVDERGIVISTRVDVDQTLLALRAAGALERRSCFGYRKTFYSVVDRLPGLLDRQLREANVSKASQD